MKRIGVGLFIALAFSPSIVFAQQTSSSARATIIVPRFVRFAGALKDSTGKPLTRTVGITFTLHREQQGGAALWLETQNVPLNAAGRYNVLLGATKPDGIPIELFTSGEAQWLGVQVEGQEEQPRVLLVSVPYALKAQEAETLAGRPASQFVSMDTLKEQVRQEVKAQAQPASKVKPATKSAGTAVVSQGATNFSDTTANQVVSVIQLGSGAAINASAPASNGIVSKSGSPTGIALYGQATSTAAGISYGVRGDSSAVSGRGFRGIAFGSSGVGAQATALGTGGIGLLGESKATTGTNNGVKGTDASPSGVAGVFDNTAGGKILSLRNNNVEKFGVLGNGNATTSGDLTAAGKISGSAASFSGNTSTIVNINQSGDTPAMNVSSAGGGIFLNTPSGTALVANGEQGVIASSTSGIGVSGSSGDGTAITAINDSPSGSPTLFVENNESLSASNLVFETNGSFFGGECAIDVAGNFGCTGTKSAVVSVSGGRKIALYAVEAPQNWFEDFGSGQLSGGAVTIMLEPTFAQTVNTSLEYHVFLTPRADCKGLFVSKETPSSFEVREMSGGTSNVTFDYRVIAKRRGYESTRLADMTRKFQKPNLTRVKRVNGSR